MRHNESQLQRDCVKWFRYQYPHLKKLFFAIPNGGKRNRVEAAIMHGEGVVAGVADLFLAVPRNDFHGLFIEMKSGKNGLTEFQADFKAAVEKHGFKMVVCHSTESFRRELEAYLGKVTVFISPPRVPGEEPRRVYTGPHYGCSNIDNPNGCQK